VRRGVPTRKKVRQGRRPSKTGRQKRKSIDEEDEAEKFSYQNTFTQKDDD